MSLEEYSDILENFGISDKVFIEMTYSRYIKERLATLSTQEIQSLVMALYAGWALRESLLD